MKRVIIFISKNLFNNNNNNNVYIFKYYKFINILYLIVNLLL